jgi:hypothetical protein
VEWISLLNGFDGPAGGKIFYDKGTYSDGWRYIEVPLSDQDAAGVFNIAWGGNGTLIGCNAAALGSGRENTMRIVAALGSGTYAAKICDSLIYGGYRDWYLPSQDDLNIMFQERAIIGGFSTTALRNYWSSSEINSTQALGQDFHDGGQSIISAKTNEYKIRAVRYF